jgi:hypothetical protein
MFIWGSPWEEKLFDIHRRSLPVGSQGSVETSFSEPAQTPEPSASARHRNVYRKAFIIDQIVLGSSFFPGAVTHRLQPQSTE